MRAILAGAITAIASYATLFGFLLPRITVEPLIQIDPQNPYSQVFKVSNQGNLDLKRVYYGCRLKGGWIDLRTDPATIHSDESRWMEMVPFVKGEAYRTLVPSESDSLTCKWFTEPFSFMLEDKRQIAIVVSYRPAYFPSRLEKRFAFALSTSSEGRYHWIPIANERE